ncbi:unnamed protein product [Rotaria sordida]|uniref:G-protein coupled receptors family 1 profile domain-containing protein n=1 Tax=Rotaria sordida TaxID=392033 RepID=A0A819EE86_9BILA|nr:unnamed protein product [Rotaria sordida]
MVQMDMSLMLFTHYLFGYIGTTICSIGLVLALCSVYIFTRRQMRSVVSTYLAGLSISDSCLLLLGLVFAINYSIPPNRQSESFYSSTLHKYLFPYVYACIIWFQFTSVWVIIGFAIDRWFAIKWPMLHYTHGSKRAGYIVVTIYCLGFIYSLPRFFEYKTEVRREELSVFENYTEYIDHIVISNKLHNSSIYQFTVHLILYSLFQSILPLLMLSYFNVELIRSIHASSNFLQRCTPLYRQNTRITRETNTIRFREGVVTRSVICLIGLFTICQVPASILHYIYMFYRNHRWLYICYDISNFLILFNSAVNFFIFACFNRKFRRELTQVCCHTKHQSLSLRTSSHQMLARTNSPMRTLQQIQLNIAHPNYWEYQKRINNGNIYPIQKQSFKSTSQFRSIYRRTSNSLYNINLTKSNQLNYDRYSICECNYKNSSLKINNEQKFKYKTKDNYYHNCNNDEYLLNTKKPYSSSHNTINGYIYEQKLHYIPCRCKNNQQKILRSSTSSNLLHSTRNTKS